MVDTQRTLVDLLTNLFQDGQADGSITPQDVRDLIVSLIPSIGAIYFSTPVETVISTVSTKTLALGTTTATSDLHDIDMPQNNRIRYIGTVRKHFIIDVALSASTIGNNKVIEYQLCKNGVPIPETLMTRAHPGAGNAGTVALTTNTHLDPNDYIELYVSNETDDTNLIINNGTINLTGFLIE